MVVSGFSWCFSGLVLPWNCLFRFSCLIAVLNWSSAVHLFWCRTSLAYDRVRKPWSLRSSAESLLLDPTSAKCSRILNEPMLRVRGLQCRTGCCRLRCFHGLSWQSWRQSKDAPDWRRWKQWLLLLGSVTVEVSTSDSHCLHSTYWHLNFNGITPMSGVARVVPQTSPDADTSDPSLHHHPITHQTVYNSNHSHSLVHRFHFRQVSSARIFFGQSSFPFTLIWKFTRSCCLILCSNECFSWVSGGFNCCFGQAFPIIARFLFSEETPRMKNGQEGFCQRQRHFRLGSRCFLGFLC